MNKTVTVELPEWEAVELFPAESRLRDPSNMRTLHAFPKVPLGTPGRLVMDSDRAMAPQRPLRPETPEAINGH